MKIKSLLFLLIISPHIIFSQSDYKISAEGFTFGTPVGNNVKLTVFLSASNIGAIDEFNGQIRNIKLTSRQDNSGNYILDEYTKILDNDKRLNGYSVFSLSYIVPVDATDLLLILPPIYGSLNIPITKENYSQWSAKGKNAENNPPSNANNFFSKLNKYVGIGFGIGGANTIFKSSLAALIIDLSIYPKLFSFGKNNKFTLGASFSWTPTMYVGANKEKDIYDFYGYNLNQDSIIRRAGDTASMYAYFLGGGLGVSAKFGDAVPTLILNYGHYTNSVTGFSVKNTNTGTTFSNPSFSGSVWKIDFLISYKYYSNFKYSFIYGNLNSSSSSNKGIFRGHYFTIGIGGF